ncbi:MAG: hypothetical protein ACK5VR_00060, partial [Burkholderiales bacterium]
GIFCRSPSAAMAVTGNAASITINVHTTNATLAMQYEGSVSCVGRSIRRLLTGVNSLVLV